MQHAQKRCILNINHLYQSIDIHRMWAEVAFVFISLKFLLFLLGEIQRHEKCSSDDSGYKYGILCLAALLLISWNMEWVSVVLKTDLVSLVVSRNYAQPHWWGVHLAACDYC